MALSIQLKGVNFSAGNQFAGLPLRTNLVAEYVFGGNEASSKDNRVTGAADAVVSGSPTYNQYSAVFSPSAFFDTGVKDSDSNLQTFIIVAKKPSTAGIYMGAFGSGGGPDSAKNLFFESDTFKASTTGALAATVASVSAASANTSSYYFLALRTLQDTVKLRAYLTAGTATDATATGGNSTINRNIRIGCGYNNGNFPGPLELAFGGIYNASLTDQQLLDAYNFLKDFYTGKITMV